MGKVELFKPLQRISEPSSKEQLLPALYLKLLVLLNPFYKKVIHDKKIVIYSVFICVCGLICLTVSSIDNNSSQFDKTISPVAYTLLLSADQTSYELKRIKQDRYPTHSFKVDLPINTQSEIKTINLFLPRESTELQKKKSMIKFLAGMIAIHRPSIADCGAVARDIVELSLKQKVDPFFIAAIISVESRFSSNARSHQGATGLMQIMPNTAMAITKSKYGKIPSKYLTNPRINLNLGVEYIKQLEKQYSGNRFLALAAYNWGPGNLQKVKLKTSRIPKSVRKYSTTIIERTNQWQRHYQKAKQSIDALDAEFAITPIPEADT